MHNRNYLYVSKHRSAQPNSNTAHIYTYSSNRTQTSTYQYNTQNNNPNDKRNGERQMRKKAYIKKGNFLRVRVIPVLVLFVVFTLMFSTSAFSSEEKDFSTTNNTSDATFTVTNANGKSVSGGTIKPQNLTFTVTNQLPITDATIKITRDGGTETVLNLDIQGNSASGTYNFSADGKYQAIITVSDEQSAKDGTFNFTVDGSGPEITITGAENNKIYPDSASVNISIQDQGEYTVDTFTATRTDLNGQKHSLGKGNINNGKFEQTFNEEGIYNFHIIAKDKSGNTTEKSHTFTIDKSNPKVTGNYDNGTIKLTAKDYSLDLSKTNAKLLHEGKDTDTAITFKKTNAYTAEATIALPKEDGKPKAGQYQVQWEAHDALGKKTTGTFTQTVGNPKPSIGITGVNNDGLYNANKPVTITIKNTNHDFNKVTITRNKQKYNAGSFAISGNTATLSHTFSAEGKYEILVEAQDRSGNSLTKKTSFTIDKKAPVIKAYVGQGNRTIKNGEYYNTRFTPRITLGQKGDSIVSVTLNGRNVTGRIPVISTEGKYNLSVKARDKAGNESVLNTSFTLDVTKPTLDISGVVGGYLNEDVQPVITYYDKNLDKNKTKVTLNGLPYESGTVLELEQEYILEAYIVDLAGNVTEESITFTIDKTAPVIKFMEPISAQYFNKSIVPDLLIEDLSDYEVLSMTLNGEPYEIGGEIEDEGKHVLYFEVKDKAGNIQTLGVEFTIDTTPPKVDYDGVEKNGVYHEPVYVRIILNDPLDRILRVTVNGELFRGEMTEIDGKRFIKVPALKLGDYEIKAIAVDEAGNETELVIPFTIAEKNAFIKFYENKPAFLGSVAGLVALLGATGTLAYRTLKKRREAKQISDDYFN